MEAGSDARRRVGVVVALLFLAVSAASSPFWRQARELFSIPTSSYPALRTAYAFGGIPMDEITARLNEMLPPEVPVAFGSGILGRVFEEQRFTEVLYPRLVDQSSPQKVDIVPDARQPAAGERALGRYRSGMSLFRVVFTGPAAAPVRDPAPPLPLDFSWSGFLGACLAVMGIGLVLESLFPMSRSDGVPAAALATVFCAFAFGVLATAATVLQVPAPWRAIAVLGPFVFVAFVLAAERRGRRVSRAARDLAAALRMPENWLLISALVLLAARIARVPIMGWDGRSDWFFRTKQLFHHGMLAKSDAVQPFLVISHEEYPLLFPAWASFFTSLSRRYNERMASMAIPVLLSAIVGSLWILSRRRMGRWIGACFVLIAFLGVQQISSAGDVDGLLCLLVALEFLCFSAPGLESAGWAAAGAASLLKREGLLFALLTAAACTLFLPHWRSRARQARFLPFLAFLPAVGFAWWVNRLGIRGDFAGIRWKEVLSDFPRRTGVIGRAVADVVGNGSLNTLTKGLLAAEGVVAAGASVLLLAMLRRRSASSSCLAFALAVAFGAVDVSAFLVTPRELEWHVATSIARLLLLPSIFFVLAGFLLLRDWALGNSVSNRDAFRNPTL